MAPHPCMQRCAIVHGVFFCRTKLTKFVLAHTQSKSVSKRKNVKITDPLEKDLALHLMCIFCRAFLYRLRSSEIDLLYLIIILSSSSYRIIISHPHRHHNIILYLHHHRRRHHHASSSSPLSFFWLFLAVPCAVRLVSFPTDSRSMENRLLDRM